MAGGRDFDVLFEPTDTTSLAGATMTRNQLVLNVLDDVKNRLSVVRHGADGWTSEPLRIGDMELGTTSVGAVDADESDALWITTTNYVTPTTLMLAEQPGKAEPETLKTMPVFFDASNDVIEQHFATSKDGTRVPYFIVHRKDQALDGSAPTLLYGYGGFEISLTPSYSGTVGKGWLERGGVYVVANIRGGGDYGPPWHQAAPKEKRHKAYEDFAAVAKELVARKIPSPQHLAAMGGGNDRLAARHLPPQSQELARPAVTPAP